MKNIFFDSWESLVRTFLITIMAYVLLIFLLRISGKRTLSKMNAFDLIVTIALGSTLASVILNKNVALADGVLGFFLLIFLQYLISSLSIRYRWVSNLVKATPTLLVYKGVLYADALRKERITEEEINAVVREKGLQSVKDAGAIVLETDGSLTLIPTIESLQADAIKQLNKPAALRNSRQDADSPL